VREALAELRFGERAPAGRPFVHLNMIATLDGRAALGGSTRGLGSRADLGTLLELREGADAVLVGTRTVRAEGYGRLLRDPARRARRRAAGRPEDPPAVLVARGPDVPWEAPLLAEPEQPVLLYAAAPVPAPAGVEVVALPDPSPRAVLADLRRRGVRSLLCEGGPTLNRALLADGLVDELFLTLAPLLTGDDREPAIVAGPPLPAPVGLTLRWVLRHGNELLLRYGAIGEASAP